MARQTEKRHAELRARLVDIAEAGIRENGLDALRARALAAEAGCAVGAIYTVFDDMTGLVLAVNMRTFDRLGAHVAAAVAAEADRPGLERLIVMAEAYVDFAAANPRLWRALFDVEMTADSDVPAWYRDELARLFRMISEPLAEFQPGATPEEIALRTRALFSAVHGVMLLSLENRVSGVPQAHLKEMIGFLLRRVAGH